MNEKHTFKLKCLITAITIAAAAPMLSGSAAPLITDAQGSEPAAKIFDIQDYQTSKKAKIEKIPDKLIPMGNTIGIKIFSEGVMVVGISEIKSAEGTVSPAEMAGLKKGDMILKVNGEDVSSAEKLTELIRQSNGGAMVIGVKRGDKELSMNLQPALCADDGVYKAGIWIRDSMAGIGTMTYYDPKSGAFGALGHGINDVDTSTLVRISSGAIMGSSVVSVKKGEAGSPGELQGSFDLSEDMGTITANTDGGIFGFVDSRKLELGKAVPVASRNEIKIGKAKIMSNVEENKIELYDIEIIKLYPSAMGSQRNMMIKITDEDLIAKTGGIVQGMSGSPILQDGRIVGAVTHVLVNDPTRGYGIYVGNMLEKSMEKLGGNAA